MMLPLPLSSTTLRSKSKLPLIFFRSKISRFKSNKRIPFPTNGTFSGCVPWCIRKLTVDSMIICGKECRLTRCKQLFTHQTVCCRFLTISCSNYLFLRYATSKWATGITIFIKFREESAILCDDIFSRYRVTKGFKYLVGHGRGGFWLWARVVKSKSCTPSRQ